jgi:dihydrolipoamide dehydrogenase
LIGAENAGILVNQGGFIPADQQMCTNVPHIFAIGDIIGQPMLAHKTVHEGKVAVEVAAGRNGLLEAKFIPSAAYTDPEVAWVGVIENEAKAEGIKYGKMLVPLGRVRPLALARPRRGPDQGAVRRGERTDHRLRHRWPERRRSGRGGHARDRDGRGHADIGLTSHSHPTLAETIGMATEMFEGSITDVVPPNRRH